MNQRVWEIEQSRKAINSVRPRSSMAYYAVVAFSLIYFARPEDFIPFGYVPIGKIAGGVALFALIFGVPAPQRHKLTIELKVLLLLLADMIFCIPLAAWRGGAFDTVVNKFSKGVIVAILIYMVVTSLKELRKLLAIQAGTVALVTMASVIVHHTKFGRLKGIQNGILENPNDLAINIAINFPLCLAFLLAAKGVGRKLFWAGALAFMSWAVIATYSRAGMLAMVLAVAISLWEFGVRGKRIFLLVSAGVIVIIAMGVMLATPHYVTRIESIFVGNIEGSFDRGSMEQRGHLLKESLWMMVTHPLWGVGPGNFPSSSGTWLVAHNTYAELGAETGLPGLILFVVLMGLIVRKIRSVRQLPGCQSSKDIGLWTSGLWAAIAAYIAAAMFGSTEYNLFPYFMVGYICALYNIASVAPSADPTLCDLNKGRRKEKFGGNAKREKQVAWTG